MSDEVEALLDDIEYAVDEERGHRPPRVEPICPVLFYRKGLMAVQAEPWKCVLHAGHNGDHVPQHEMEAPHGD